MRIFFGILFANLFALILARPVTAHGAACLTYIVIFYRVFIWYFIPHYLRFGFWQFGGHSTGYIFWSMFCGFASLPSQYSDLLFGIYSGINHFTVHLADDFWHPVWHFMSHSTWHICSHILADISSGIPADIFSGIAHVTSHLAYMLALRSSGALWIREVPGLRSSSGHCDQENMAVYTSWDARNKEWERNAT